MTKHPNATDVHVGKRMRMRRLMLQMSQEAFATKLGVTFQQVQKYEKGVNRVSASRLQQACNVLQVPVQFFFEGLPKTETGAKGREAIIERSSKDATKIGSERPEHAREHHV